MTPQELRKRKHAANLQRRQKEEIRGKEIKALKEEVCIGASKNFPFKDYNWKSDGYTMDNLASTAEAGLPAGSKWVITQGCSFENLGTDISIYGDNLGATKDGDFIPRGTIVMGLTVGKNQDDEKNVVVVLPSDEHLIRNVFVYDLDAETYQSTSFANYAENDTFYNMSLSGKASTVNLEQEDLNVALTEKLGRIDPRLAEAFEYTVGDREQKAAFVQKEEALAKAKESKGNKAYSQLRDVTDKTVTKEGVNKGKGLFGRLFSRGKEMDDQK